MATSELEKNDGILGNIPRHCILHAVTVIETAIFKESCTVLDDFVQELTNLVYPKGKHSNSRDLPQLDSQLIPTLEVNQFYESAITTQEFAIKLEKGINDVIKQSVKTIDIEDIQMICWKYYSSEKKKALSFPKWLSPTCTYRLFVIFNQLLGDEMTVHITEQKMNYLLERIVLSCGFQSQAILQVVKNEHKSGIAFPEFLEEITNAFEFLKLEMSLTCEMILDLLDEIVMGVLKKGYLIKRGGNRKNWKKRWFILKENTLFYYESRENLTQKGGMVLNKASDVISLPDEKGKLYRFVITCGLKGRAFEIKASDQRTKSEWLHAIREAISLGRLKRNDIEDNADPCEMAAHYRLKYGLSGNELTKSLPTLQHGQFNTSSSLSTNVTSSAVPPIQELDSGSDSDGAVPLPSPQNPRRVKSYDEKKLSQSSGMLDVRRQVAKDQKKHGPKFRHSSFIPQSGSDMVDFTANEEVSNSGYVNASVASRTLSSPSVQPSNQYHYVRNSVAVVEDITGVYGTSPKIQRHGYQNIKRPVDAQGDKFYDEEDDNATDEVYEDMDYPGEEVPPVPPRQSQKPPAGGNKYVDSDGYLRIYPSNPDNSNAAPDTNAYEHRQNVKSTISDHPKLSDPTS